MDKQTIDGVPRELVQRIAKYIDDGLHLSLEERDLLDELRALLDAPACKECEDVGYHVTMGVQRSCWACKPAAQPQPQGEGEPVAWRVTGRGGLTVTSQYPKWAVGERGLTITPLYAEQPAPAACPGDGVNPCKNCKCVRHS